MLLNNLEESDHELKIYGSHRFHFLRLKEMKRKKKKETTKTKIKTKDYLSYL